MTTLQNFGIPVDGRGRGGILQPKTKHKFRVRVFNFGPVAGGLELTQQVTSASRPNLSQPSVRVDSYNSIGYYAGKAEWQPIDVTVRDDVTNSVSRLIGHQVQKQTNHFQQTSPLAGINYTFVMTIETLTGDNTTVLEKWTMEGCFIEGSNWDSFDYSSSDPMTIQLSIRFQNATLDGGLMPLLPAISNLGQLIA